MREDAPIDGAAVALVVGELGRHRTLGPLLLGACLSELRGCTQAGHTSASLLDSMHTTNRQLRLAAVADVRTSPIPQGTSVAHVQQSRACPSAAASQCVQVDWWRTVGALRGNSWGQVDCGCGPRVYCAGAPGKSGHVDGSKLRADTLEWPAAGGRQRGSRARAQGPCASQAEGRHGVAPRLARTRSQQSF